MNRKSGLVYVIDDDLSILKSVARLLSQAGYEVKTFETPEELLECRGGDCPDCLVLDLKLKETDGIKIQEEMARRNIKVPIVFITGYGTVPSSVQALKAGAEDFLEKPFDNWKLLEAVGNAVAKNIIYRTNQSENEKIEQCLITLTPREREVLSHVISGKLNKQTAADMGIAEKTVKVHRARVMRKMGVVSLAELVRAASKAGISPPQ